MKKTQKGFTLVELLVVIAILAILATVSVVGYTSFIDKAKLSNAQTEAHQIATLIESALMTENEVIVTTVKSENEVGVDGQEATISTTTPSYIVATKGTDGKITFGSANTTTDVKTDLTNDLKDFNLELSGTNLHYTSKENVKVDVLSGNKIYN